MDWLWADRTWDDTCVVCHTNVGTTLIKKEDRQSYCHKCANSPLPNAETLQANVITYLNERGKFFAIQILEKCRLKYSVQPVYKEEFKKWGIEFGVCGILIGGTVEIQKILRNAEHRATQALNEAFSAIVSPNISIFIIGVHQPQEGNYTNRAWGNIISNHLQRRALANLKTDVEQPDIHNQALGAMQPRIWENFRFRSESEVRIAAALDKVHGVMFLPNCKARVGSSDSRLNREPDFLVCYKGKWGILEVDGEPSHPPTRTVEDHERDRLFRLHGVQVVEHFDAGECFENPDGVVRKFLYLLSHSK